MPFHTPHAASIAYPEVYYVKPTIDALRHRDDLTLTGFAPQHLSSAITGNRFSTYLLPPWLLIQAQNLLIIPGVGVAANGETGSERLITEAPLDAIESIAVHPNAHHLVPLLQMSYLEQNLPLPTFSSPYDENTPNILYSGDEGRAQQAAPGHDLGILWQEISDLPLVLGVWACGPGAPYRSLRHTLGEVARTIGDPDHESAQRSPRLHYDLLSRESDSLRQFNTLAIRHHLGEANEEAIAFC